MCKHINGKSPADCGACERETLVPHIPDEQLEAEFLADIVVTAVEGGIGYWARIRNYHFEYEGPEKRRIVSATAKIQSDSAEEDALTWIELNPALIRKGIDLIVSNQVKIAPSFQNDIAGANVRKDAGDIDADGADCIVQAALFGELVYG